MRNYLGIVFFVFLLSCSNQSRKTINSYSANDKLKLPHLIEATTDAGFGGFYLKIEKAMKDLKISRLEAHEIQNQMRDELISISGSLSVYTQYPYLEKALETAIYNVTKLKIFESGFKPRYLKPGSFYVVLDLDETLFTQWYEYGLLDASERKSHLGTSVRDKVIRSVDRKTGKNLEKVKVINGPNTITFRPKLDQFFKQLKKIKGYQGFVIFTAKDDLATWDIIKRWRHKQPRLFNQLKGVFTRNYLRYGNDFSKPSKDLRILNENLKHVILVDDNESRVIQKNLNYKIPKFNADYFWGKYFNGNVKDEKWLFDSVLDFVSSQIKSCQGRQITSCFESRIGTQDSDNTLYYLWLKKRLPRLKVDLKKIEKDHLFHQPFSFKDQVFVEEKFPQFKQGKTAL